MKLLHDLMDAKSSHAFLMKYPFVKFRWYGDGDQYCNECFGRINANSNLLLLTDYGE